MSVALSASNPRCRSCSPTCWTATSWSSTRVTCPPSARPRCASKSSTAHVVAPPQARRVQPRPEWRSLVAQRWQQYRQIWSTVTRDPAAEHTRRIHRNTCPRRGPNPNRRASPGASSRDDLALPRIRSATGLIYVSRLLTDRAMAHLHSLGVPVRVGTEAPPSRAELEAGIAGASAAVITLTEHVDADVLAAAGPQLKVIANVAVGFDNIDLAAAEAAGVTITNTPGVLDRASADHTFALILDATRRITEGDRLIRSRQPWVWGPRMLVGLDISAGATLGILGYGRIGQAVARRAHAFDMTVVATSRSRTPVPSRTVSPSSTPLPCWPTATSSPCTPRSLPRRTTSSTPPRCGYEADRIPDQHRPRWRRRRSGVDRRPAQRPNPRCRSGCVRR